MTRVNSFCFSGADGLKLGCLFRFGSVQGTYVLTPLFVIESSDKKYSAAVHYSSTVVGRRESYIISHSVPHVDLLG
jgi:hypothetical protein